MVLITFDVGNKHKLIKPEAGRKDNKHSWTAFVELEDKSLNPKIHLLIEKVGF